MRRAATAGWRRTTPAGIAFVALLGAAAGALTCPPARADDARLRAESLAAEADRAERAGRIEEALATWEEVRRLAPTARTARRADTRIAWILARRDGDASAPDFRALADFQRMRVLSDDELRSGALAAYEVRLDGYPPGRSRREGRALVAETWSRLGDRARAEAAYRAWLAEPGLEDVGVQLAASGLARLLSATGRTAEGVRLMESVGLGGGNDAADLRREQRRAPLRVAAWAAIALFPALALGLGGWRGLSRARRRALLGRAGAISPARVLAAAWVLLVPLVVASLYDHAATDSFVLLVAGGAALLALGAVAGAGLQGAAPWRRMAAATAAVAATLGVGFLVLERAGALLGLGL